jgi:hypothetical protein
MYLYVEVYGIYMAHYPIRLLFKKYDNINFMQRGTCNSSNFSTINLCL